MKKHILTGVVNESIDRPDKELLEGFKKHDVAKVLDAMGAVGNMHHEIKPIKTGMKVLGPAVTVVTRPGDALFIQKVADVAQEGDVIVVDAGGNKDLAIIGERISYYMKELRGINGIVVDGAIRDKAGIIDVGFPTFARGATPRLFGTRGPGAINVPIQCGGVTVNPGDLIFGDDDGVVVVPKEDIERVLEGADLCLEGELDRLSRMKAGEKMSDIFNCDEKIAKLSQE